MSSVIQSYQAFWREFASRWRTHRQTDNAASLAFYSLFSLAPLLLIGVTVAASILGERAAHGQLERQLMAVVGGDAAAFIENLMKGSVHFTRSASPLGYCITAAVMLYSSSHVLSKLRDTLNLVNGSVASDPARPFVTRMLARGLCAMVILMFGVVLVVGTAAEGIVAYLAGHMDFPLLRELPVIRGYHILSTYLLLGLAFLLVLKILPRRRPLWRHAFLGAALAAVVVGSLKGGLDLYLRLGFLASLFSAGFSILAFLLWLFLSIQAFLAGAEITAMLGKESASGRTGEEE
jgi:membrane protein